MGKRVFTKDMANIKTAEVIECPNCAFEFGTIHEQSEMPGLYSCPNCQEDNLEADNFQLKEENKRLREALEFYADEKNNYHKISFTVGEWDMVSTVVRDNGEIARKVLQGGEIK